MLTPKRLERHVKGFSNHRRIQIMLLLEKHSGPSLVEISDKTKINLKTAADHTRRLSSSGMINKKRRLGYVAHSLTPRGKLVLRFLKSLE